MLENKVYIIDDLIPEDYQNYLFDVFHTNIPFYLSKPDWHSAGYIEQNKDWPSYYTEENNLKDKIYDKSQMLHFFVKEGVIEDNIFYQILPIYHYLQKYFNYTFLYDIFRSKVNLKHQLSPEYSKMFNPPHIDDKRREFWSLIYYVNDSDGDTIFFNEFYQGNVVDNFTLNQTCTPKKGRIAFFPSSLYHSANFPTKNRYRLILNNILQIVPRE